MGGAHSVSVEALVNLLVGSDQVAARLAQYEKGVDIPINLGGGVKSVQGLNKVLRNTKSTVGDLATALDKVVNGRGSKTLAKNSKDAYNSYRQLYETVSGIADKSMNIGKAFERSTKYMHELQKASEGQIKRSPTSGSYYSEVPYFTETPVGNNRKNTIESTYRYNNSGALRTLAKNGINTIVMDLGNYKDKGLQQRYEELMTRGYSNNGTSYSYLGQSPSQNKQGKVVMVESSQLEMAKEALGMQSKSWYQNAGIKPMKAAAYDMLSFTETNPLVNSKGEIRVPKVLVVDDFSVNASNGNLASKENGALSERTLGGTTTQKITDGVILVDPKYASEVGLEGANQFRAYGTKGNSMVFDYKQMEADIGKISGLKDIWGNTVKSFEGYDMIMSGSAAKLAKGYSNLQAFQEAINAHPELLGTATHEMSTSNNTSYTMLDLIDYAKAGEGSIRKIAEEATAQINRASTNVKDFLDVTGIREGSSIAKTLQANPELLKSSGYQNILSKALGEAVTTTKSISAKGALGELLAGRFSAANSQYGYIMPDVQPWVEAMIRGAYDANGIIDTSKVTSTLKGNEIISPLGALGEGNIARNPIGNMMRANNVGTEAISRYVKGLQNYITLSNFTPFMSALGGADFDGDTGIFYDSKSPFGKNIFRDTVLNNTTAPAGNTGWDVKSLAEQMTNGRKATKSLGKQTNNQADLLSAIAQIGGQATKTERAALDRAVDAYQMLRDANVDITKNAADVSQYEKELRASLKEINPILEKYGQKDVASNMRALSDSLKTGTDRAAKEAEKGNRIVEEPVVQQMREALNYDSEYKGVNADPQAIRKMLENAGVSTSTSRTYPELGEATGGILREDALKNARFDKINNAIRAARGELVDTIFPKSLIENIPQMMREAFGGEVDSISGRSKITEDFASKVQEAYIEAAKRGGEGTFSQGYSEAYKALNSRELRAKADKAAVDAGMKQIKTAEQFQRIAVDTLTNMATGETTRYETAEAQRIIGDSILAAQENGLKAWGGAKAGETVDLKDFTVNWGGKEYRINGKGLIAPDKMQTVSKVASDASVSKRGKVFSQNLASMLSAYTTYADAMKKYGSSGTNALETIGNVFTDSGLSRQALGEAAAYNSSQLMAMAEALNAGFTGNQLRNYGDVAKDAYANLRSVAQEVVNTVGTGDIRYTTDGGMTGLTNAGQAMMEKFRTAIEITDGLMKGTLENNTELAERAKAIDESRIKAYDEEEKASKRARDEIIKNAEGETQALKSAAEAEKKYGEEATKAADSTKKAAEETAKAAQTEKAAASEKAEAAKQNAETAKTEAKAGDTIMMNNEEKAKTEEKTAEATEETKKATEGGETVINNTAAVRAGSKESTEAIAEKAASQAAVIVSQRTEASRGDFIDRIAFEQGGYYALQRTDKAGETFGKLISGQEKLDIKNKRLTVDPLEEVLMNTEGLSIYAKKAYDDLTERAQKFARKSGNAEQILDRGPNGEILEGYAYNKLEYGKAFEEVLNGEITPALADYYGALYREVPNLMNFAMGGKNWNPIMAASGLGTKMSYGDFFKTGKEFIGTPYELVEEGNARESRGMLSETQNAYLKNLVEYRKAEGDLKIAADKYKNPLSEKQIKELQKIAQNAPFTTSQETLDRSILKSIVDATQNYTGRIEEFHKTYSRLNETAQQIRLENYRPGMLASTLDKDAAKKFVQGKYTPQSFSAMDFSDQALIAQNREAAITGKAGGKLLSSAERNTAIANYEKDLTTAYNKLYKPQTFSGMIGAAADEAQRLTESAKKYGDRVKAQREAEQTRAAEEAKLQTLKETLNGEEIKALNQNVENARRRVAAANMEQQYVSAPGENGERISKRVLTEEQIAASENLKAAKETRDTRVNAIKESIALQEERAKGAAAAETESRRQAAESAQSAAILGPIGTGKLASTAYGLKAFSTQMTNVSNNAMMEMMGAQMVFEQFKGIVSSMYNYGKEFDDQMAEYKKIQPNWNEKDMRKYVKGLSDMGQTYGKTMSELAEASIVMTRAGYGGEDTVSKQINRGMTNAALLMSAVADSEVTVDDAASQLVAVGKAYGYDDTTIASETERWVDRYNEVSNNFAVESNALAEAIPQVASMAATNGLTEDELVGLVTGGGEMIFR